MKQRLTTEVLEFRAIVAQAYPIESKASLNARRRSAL